MLLDLLKQRYSCRAFAPTPIPKEVIEYMLECARLSPSGGNEQPWMFGIITDREQIAQIAQAASVNYKQKWIETAPLLVVLATQQLKMDEAIALHRFPTLRSRIESLDQEVYQAINMEEHQCKIPGEHMVLAALEHGVYSTWISSMDCEKVKKICALEGYLVSNVIAFGYPALSHRTRQKKALCDITFENRYHKKDTNV
ncbi:MAG: nitroreductase [Erysipelotrichaceae bacterium]|nr:nitroreductase [Erysipelotrichaceae bacterium]